MCGEGCAPAKDADDDDALVAASKPKRQGLTTVGGAAQNTATEARLLGHCSAREEQGEEKRGRRDLGGKVGKRLNFFTSTGTPGCSRKTHAKVQQERGSCTSNSKNKIKIYPVKFFGLVNENRKMSCVELFRNKQNNSN